MAHSYLIYDDYHQSFDDAKLTLVALFTADFVRKNKKSDAKYFSEEWEKDFEWFPPGAIDLRLEELFSTPKHLAILYQTLRHSREAVQKYGEHISESNLQEVIKSDWSSPGNGIDTSIVLKSFDEVIEFVEMLCKSKGVEIQK